MEGRPHSALVRELSPWPAVDQLVGRAAEVEVLDRALRELDRGRGGALEVAGEPGIGKTRLLAELGARADDQGMLVLSGSASELERELPFWLFVDAMDEYLRGLEPARLDRLGADTREHLTHVFPSLETAGMQRVSTARDERYRTHRRFTTCSRCWQPSKRSYCCWTICTGLTRARSTCSARCCDVHPMPLCCWRSDCGHASRRSVCRRRSSGRGAQARWCASSSRDSARRRRDNCSAAPWTRPRRRRCTGRAAAIRSTCSSLPGRRIRCAPSYGRQRGAGGDRSPAPGCRSARRGAVSPTRECAAGARRGGGGGRPVRAGACGSGGWRHGGCRCRRPR
jgi:AAA ATPase domain